MFVLGLLLVNIVLLAVRALQPGAYSGEESTVENRENKPLPPIQLVESQPPAPGPPKPAPVEMIEEPSGAIAMLESTRCIRVGPFADPGESAGLRSELEARFEQVRTRETSSVTNLGYWVNIPPLPTRDEAKIVVEKLKAADAGEFYRVPRGISANAIALGIFRSQTRAENRRKKILELDLGMDVIIELQTKTESHYWLEAGPLKDSDPAPIQFFSGHPELQQLEVNCPVEPLDHEQDVIDPEMTTESMRQGDIVTGN